jgi:ribosomal protein L15E
MELKVDVYMKNSEGKIVDIYHETITEDDLQYWIEEHRHQFLTSDRWEVESINVTEVKM